MSLVFVCGCARFAADASHETFQPVRISALEVDAAFSANRKVAENACPCCKTALAVSADGTLYASWRQVLPKNFRHIAVASSTDGGAKFSAPVIVSDDKWKLQGCPVSGPSLSADANGTLKVVWYAAGEGDAPGLYFAETRDRGRAFSPRTLLMQEPVKGTPALATGDTRAIAIWQGIGAAQASGTQQIETKLPELGGAGHCRQRRGKCGTAHRHV